MMLVSNGFYFDSAVKPLRQVGRRKGGGHSIHKTVFVMRVLFGHLVGAIRVSHGGVKYLGYHSIISTMFPSMPEWSAAGRERPPRGNSTFPIEVGIGMSWPRSALSALCILADAGIDPGTRLVQDLFGKIKIVDCP